MGFGPAVGLRKGLREANKDVLIGASIAHMEPEEAEAGPCFDYFSTSCSPPPTPIVTSYP